MRCSAALGSSEASLGGLVHAPTTSTHKPRPRADDVDAQASVPQRRHWVASSLEDVVVPDSEDDDDDVCLCKRCGKVHGVKDIEECRRVRREQSRCKRCGLVHKDYDCSAWIIHGLDKFCCELFIPNVDELQMDGDTIILPPHVQSRIDELSSRAWSTVSKAKRFQKKQQDAKKKTDT
ncbi:hypothetical protein EJB05_10513, partial [Eragrostis curvula]